MKSLLSFAKRLILLCGGVAGGTVAGLILSSTYWFYARHWAGPDSDPSLFAFFITAASMISGYKFPRYFMYFVALPLAWMASGSSSGEATDVGLETGAAFLINVAYALGLVLTVIGFLFGLPIVYFGGLSLILIFCVLLINQVKQDEEKN